MLSNRLFTLPVVAIATLLSACISQSSLDASEPAYGGWRSSKIGGGGYLLNTVFCPSAPNTMYVNSDVGGIFKSTNGGKTWKMIHGSYTPALCNVRAISVDPRDADRLLAAIGNQWMPVQGIFLTEDGGRSWKKVFEAHFYGNGSTRASGNNFARDPQNPDTIYCASRDGVLKSTDAGRTWQNLGEAGHFPTDLIIDRTNPSRLWLCARPGSMRSREEKGKVTLTGGLYLSEDCGASWTKLSDNGPREMVQPACAPNELYAIFDRLYVAKSTDQGKTWQKFSNGLKLAEKSGASHTNTSYIALGDGPDFLVLGSGNGDFYQLQQGKDTWERVSYKIHQGDWFLRTDPGEWSHFARATSSVTVDPKDPKHWVFTDWYAVYQTYDSGANWHLTINGIEMTVIHSLVADPSSPGKVLLGMADNPVLTSYDSGNSFKMTGRSSSGNSKCIAVSKSNPQRVYLTGPKGWTWEANTVRVSIDGGRAWHVSPMKGVPATKNGICTITVSPTNEYEVYIARSGKLQRGDGGVYKSTDGGKTWLWDSVGMAATKAYFKDSIWRSGCELAIDTTGKTMVAIGCKDSAIYYRSTGGKWQQSTSQVDGGHYDVEADPFTAGRFYLATTHGGVFRSDDSGKTWTKLFSGDCLDVACDPRVKDQIAITLGKEEKLYISKNAGKDWTELDQNLPNRKSVKLCFSGNRLIAGTDGNGVFYLPLNPAGKIGFKAPLPREKKRENLIGMPPRKWTTWTGKGKLELIPGKDGEICLKATETDTNGSASKDIDVTRKSMYVKVSGELKTTGTNKKVMVAIQGFNKQWKQASFQQVFATESAPEWRKFSQNVRISDKAYKPRLAIILEGNGEVQVKDLQVCATPEIFK